MQTRSKKTAKTAKKPVKKAPAKKAAKKKQSSPASNAVFVERLLNRIRFVEQRIAALEAGVGFAPPTGTPVFP